MLSQKSTVGEAISGFFKPKVSPQDQVREWQRKIRHEGRNLDRSVRDIQRDEAAVKKSIKESVKRNDLGSAKHLAKELVRSRKAVMKMHEQKAQLNSVVMHLSENLAMVKIMGHLQKSTEVMKLVNSLVKVGEISGTMMELQKEMMKAGIMEETVMDTLDSTLDTEDIEEETEEEIQKVLSEIAVETTSLLPSAARKQALRQRQETVAANVEERQVVAEGELEEDEGMEAMKERLRNARGL